VYYVYFLFVDRFDVVCDLMLDGGGGEVVVLAHGVCLWVVDLGFFFDLVGSGGDLFDSFVSGWVMV